MLSRRTFSLPVLLTAAVLWLPGCLSGTSLRQPGGTSGSRVQLEFWHTRRGDQEKALRGICEDYGRTRPQIDLQPIYKGSYDQLNKAIRAAALGKALPALSVGYESQVNEYAAGGYLRPLDDLLTDPELGFTSDELKDFPTQYLESNRFPQHGNRLLSFPFTKSNLVLYYNRDLLRKSGFATPPATWPELEAQAQAISARLGAPALAFAVDPSTLDGLIFAHGGEVLAADGRTTLFDQPATIAAFTLLKRMKDAKTLVFGEDDDLPQLFMSQRCAFVMDTSSGRAALEESIQEAFDWDVATIPHAPGIEPVTVMYGPNVCIFRSTPEVEREAWRFIRYFVSPEITARWARETGYLPVRTSAAQLPEMKAFYASNRRAWNVFQTQKYARGEPRVIGWQEVRGLLADAGRAVLTGKKSPAAAARDLKRLADEALAKSR